MSAGRRYPDRPFLGIGAAILRGDEVLLVQRGQDPLKGWWSLPGGVVETGELLTNAVRREMLEETGLDVDPLAVVEVFERITPDAAGDVEFHFVVIDYVCRAIGGAMQAGDDASAAAWFRRDSLPAHLTDGAAGVIQKAFDWMLHATLKA